MVELWEPLCTGTSWPTLKEASLLSMVTILGVERMSFLVLVERRHQGGPIPLPEARRHAAEIA